MVQKLDTWIPLELKEIHLPNRINACDMHLKRNEYDFEANENLSKKIMVQEFPKPDIHQKK